MTSRWVVLGLAVVCGVAVAGEKKKAKTAAVPKTPTAEQMKEGEKVYTQTCVVCHQKTGNGLAPLFPPLANSDYLMADKKRSIAIVTKGLTGPIEVNGKKFNQVMPPLPQLTDEQVANVLTYVRNSFGNKGEVVTPAEVAEVKASKDPAPKGAAAATK